MKSKIGTSKNSQPGAAVKEAVSGIKDPLGIIFTTADYSALEEISLELSKLFPKTPMIGTTGICYAGNEIADKNFLVVTAITEGAKIAVGAIKHLATAPLSDLPVLSSAISEVRPGNEDTVCFEFCTNDEEQLVSTLNVELEKNNISLAGGTVFGVPKGEKSLVAVNGKIYSNTCAFMLIKNTSGKAYVFRENIYARDEKKIAHVATKVDLKSKKLISLDKRPAADVYSEETGIPKSAIVDNVLNRPLGRAVDKDVYISSPYEVGSDGSITCYKRINEDDTIYFLKLLNYKEVEEETLKEIRSHIEKPSLVLSVNCIYRYTLFNKENYMGTLLSNLSSLGNQSGYIGGGEQYMHQHVNQTMVCAVFE
jgi:hypothetical protein